MDCAFLKAGSDDPCHKKPVKNSQYISTCVNHKFLMKNSNVKPCKCYGKRTYSKLHICERCGANVIRVRRKCYFNSECKRLRRIHID